MLLNHLRASTIPQGRHLLGALLMMLVVFGLSVVGYKLYVNFVVHFSLSCIDIGHIPEILF